MGTGLGQRCCIEGIVFVPEPKAVPAERQVKEEIGSYRLETDREGDRAARLVFKAHKPVDYWSNCGGPGLEKALSYR